MVANQSVPGLNRGLSSDFWRLRRANHVKFTEECVICMEKIVWRGIFFFKWAKNVFGTTSLS